MVPWWFGPLLGLGFDVEVFFLGRKWMGIQGGKIHPFGRLIWNLKIRAPWKRNNIFQTSFFSGLTC